MFFLVQFAIRLYPVTAEITGRKVSTVSSRGPAFYSTFSFEPVQCVHNRLI